jgi:hypothetical protein
MANMFTKSTERHRFTKAVCNSGGGESLPRPRLCHTYIRGAIGHTPSQPRKCDVTGCRFGVLGACPVVPGRSHHPSGWCPKQIGRGCHYRPEVICLNNIALNITALPCFLVPVGFPTLKIPSPPRGLASGSLGCVSAELFFPGPRTQMTLLFLGDAYIYIIAKP